ncbi:Hypothetical protein SMAX5B_016589 [Scophthalmus maximus]|uniref:Uncharacterized protein n=1 Tax=Scophthalmus maximus TaxID=52904 RepID=A0A2U9C6A9_SCOMX|nr:Hypothetical protein SMAX5B_016589 [Scophthalmus maximus]
MWSEANEEARGKERARKRKECGDRKQTVKRLGGKEDGEEGTHRLDGHHHAQHTVTTVPAGGGLESP